MDRKPGEKTLFMSLLFGVPGPVGVGIGFLFGRTATQLSDLIRRSMELGAIIISFVQYRILYRRGEPEEGGKARAEFITNHAVVLAMILSGLAMILSGLVMLLVALLTISRERGNVVPGLIISALGAVTNLVFWIRYSRLHRKKSDGILAAQKKLYRGKTLVDATVTAALAVLLIWPGTRAAVITDVVGSSLVAVDLVISGITLWKKDVQEAAAADQRA